MQTLASTRAVPAVSGTDRAARGASRYHAQRIKPRFAASRRGARALGPARAVASAKTSPGELRLPFSHVRSEEEMFAILRAGVAQGKVIKNGGEVWEGMRPCVRMFVRVGSHTPPWPGPLRSCLPRS